MRRSYPESVLQLLSVINKVECLGVILISISSQRIVNVRKHRKTKNVHIVMTIKLCECA